MVLRIPHYRLPAVVLLASLCAIVAADPAPLRSSPDELVRQGNAAYRAGNAEVAEKLYTLAEERIDDPGLVAFNRAAVLFQKGAFREAEQEYIRVLDDSAIPPERRLRALYNRGVCLMKRGGDAGIFKTAIACFDLVIEANPTDATLASDARHNLELAKLLWAQARAKSKNPEKANDEPSPPEPKPQSQSSQSRDPDDSGTEESSKNSTGKDKTERPVGKGPKEHKSTPSTDTTPAPGTTSVLQNSEEVQPLSPEETRDLLKRIADRLERDRLANRRLLSGPERPHVRDW